MEKVGGIYLCNKWFISVVASENFNIELYIYGRIKTKQSLYDQIKGHKPSKSGKGGRILNDLASFNFISSMYLTLVTLV